MQQHYKILGILYLVYAGLNILIGFMIGSMLHMVSGFNMSTDDEMVLNIISTVIPVILIIVSLPNLVAGIGLLYQKRWALILGVILSIFNIMSLPFGTGISIYSIYILVKEEEERNRIRQQKQWT